MPFMLLLVLLAPIASFLLGFVSLTVIAYRYERQQAPESWGGAGVCSVIMGALSFAIIIPIARVLGRFTDGTVHELPLGIYYLQWILVGVMATCFIGAVLAQRKINILMGFLTVSLISEVFIVLAFFLRQ